MGSAEMIRRVFTSPLLVCSHVLFVLSVVVLLLLWSPNMAFTLRSLLLGGLVASVSGQNTVTVTVNPQHSGGPSPYPNPYQEPHQNSSWYNGQPNSPWSNATDFDGM